jgi:hypothetical protein
MRRARLQRPTRRCERDAEGDSGRDGERDSVGEMLRETQWRDTVERHSGRHSGKGRSSRGWVSTHAPSSTPRAPHALWKPSVYMSVLLCVSEAQDRQDESENPTKTRTEATYHVPEPLLDVTQQQRAVVSVQPPSRHCGALGASLCRLRSSHPLPGAQSLACPCGPTLATVRRQVAAGVLSAVHLCLCAERRT